MTGPRVGRVTTGQSVWIVKRGPDGSLRGFAATVGKIGRHWAELDGVKGLRLEISTGHVGANAESLVGEAWNSEAEWQGALAAQSEWDALRAALRDRPTPTVQAATIMDARRALGVL